MKSCVLVLLLLNAILECENSIVYRRYARPTRQVSDANDNITIANAVTEIFNECKCVDYYLCDEDNYIITDGRTIIEERMQSSGGRTLCEGGRYTGEIVCCKNRSTATLKESGIDLNNDADGFIHNLTLTTNIPIEANSMGVKPTIKTKIISCGTQLPTINIRIFAGEDELTPINGEFPWLAAIFRNVNGNYQLHCAGSLIHPKVVLTANHCVKRYRSGDLKVSINGNIEQPTIEENSQTAATKDVSEIIKHADYSSGTLSNDIALLILTEPIPINRTIHNVNTICLPPNENHVNDLKCLVAGWGRTPNNKGQKVLKKVELPTVSNERCQRLLRNTRLGPGFDLDKSFMCAGGEEGKDACKGDGGSPLMCPFNDSDRYFQAGIVSWGIGCGSKNVPGVYTKVSQFRDWIKEELGKRQISLINTV